MPRNRVAIECVVVHYAQAAHRFCAGIKRRQCTSCFPTIYHEVTVVMVTLTLLVANFAKMIPELPQYKMMQGIWKMTETLAYGYSSGIT